MHGLRSPLVGTYFGLDLYMADGGRYRRRRFAAFDAVSGTVTRKPHQPHYQSRDYNPLNGDIERWFEPVSGAVCARRHASHSRSLHHHLRCGVT